MYLRVLAPVTLALLLVACGATGQQPPEPVTSTAAPTATAAMPLAASPSPSATPTVPETVIISPVETPAEGGPVIDSQSSGGEMPEGLDEAVIVYQRSGGLAARTEWWAIFPDGRVISQDGQVGQVAPERVAELLASLEALGVFEMQDAYLPDDPCCDRYTHTLTVRRDGQAKTVTTLDAAPGAPDALWQAIDAVMALATSAT